MAHSNRQKIRDARGGLTKNQAAKASRQARYRSTFDLSARLVELKRWQEELDEQRQGKTKAQADAPKERRRYSMTENAQKRRRKVIQRLEAQIEYTQANGLDLAAIGRMQNELKVLRLRS